MSSASANIRKDVNILWNNVRAIAAQLKDTSQTHKYEIEVEVRFFSYQFNRKARKGNFSDAGQYQRNSEEDVSFGISYQQFYLMKEFLDKYAKNNNFDFSYEETIDHEWNDLMSRSQVGKAKYRRTRNLTDGSEHWIHKERIMSPIDNDDYNLRYSISRETKIALPSPSLHLEKRKFTERRKERFSYDFATAFQVDLTKVTQNEKNRFELEVEIKQNYWKIPTAYNTLVGVIISILHELHDTNKIYTVSQYRNIITYFNDTIRGVGRPGENSQTSRSSKKFGKNDNYKIEHRYLFQPRNLKYRDMVYGGLIPSTKVKKNPKTGKDVRVGSNYEYSVTIKADGKRKMLVIHDSGIWLMSAPYSANWVTPLLKYSAHNENALSNYGEFRGLNLIGTIFEGELIPMESRLLNKGAPTSRYWYLIFDCLAIANKGESYLGDTSIQRENHVLRMKYARQAKTTLDYLAATPVNIGGNNGTQMLMTIQTKDFPIFKTSEQLFQIIRRFEKLRKSSKYAYLDDGYIFTPDNMPYNLVKEYRGKQYISVHWFRIGDRVWENKYGSRIVLTDDGSFVEREPTEQRRDILVPGSHKPRMRRHIRTFSHYVISEDYEWYTTTSMTWGISGDIWKSTSKRKWFTTDPNYVRDSRKSGIPGFEEKNTLEMVDGDLWQKLEIAVSGESNIHNIPLHLRKLTHYPDICKWKPREKLTIDFATIRRGKYLQLLVAGFSDHLIPFTGTSKNPFITDPINEPFGPVDHDNEKTKHIADLVTIVEYEWKFDSKLPKMVPLKVREGKARHNQLGIANAVWDDLHDPIEINTLKGESFRLMRKYHNQIKRDLFSEAFGKTDRIYGLLDIGSGVGGDTLKWQQARRIVAVEPNETYLKELKERIYSIFHQDDTQVINPSDNTQEINEKITIADNSEHRVIIVNTGGEDSKTIGKVTKKWLGGKADVISLMLSLSFFWESVRKLSSLARTIKTNLSPEGKVIYFTIDGRIVRHAFSPIKLLNIRNSENIDEDEPGTIGNQTSDYDTLKLNDAILKFDSKENKLVIDIPSSIVRKQTEWLVFLDDLASRLPEGFQLTNTVRADHQPFMNSAEYKLSIMYTGGIIHPSTEFYETQGSSNQLSSTLINDHEVRAEVKVEVKDEEKKVKVEDDEFQIEEVTEKIGKIKISRNDDGAVKITSPTRISKTKPSLISEKPAILPISRKESKEKTKESSTSVSGTRKVTRRVTRRTRRVSDELPMLPITYDYDKDIGIGDDATEELTVSWYKKDKVVRIATIGDGSCFIHAILKAIYGPYANTSNYTTRENYAKKLRRDLAVMLTKEDPENKGKTYYQTAAGGQWPVLAEQAEEGVDYGFDPTLPGLQELLNSEMYLGDEVYQFIGNMLGINILVMKATRSDLTLLSSIVEGSPDRLAVVIAGNGIHYETVGIDYDKKGIQTAFKMNHPFIEAALIK